MKFTVYAVAFSCVSKKEPRVLTLSLIKGLEGDNPLTGEEAEVLLLPKCKERLIEKGHDPEDFNIYSAWSSAVVGITKTQ